MRTAEVGDDPTLLSLAALVSAGADAIVSRLLNPPPPPSAIAVSLPRFPGEQDASRISVAVGRRANCMTTSVLSAQQNRGSLSALAGGPGVPKMILAYDGRM